MKQILTLILIFVTFLAVGQETKKVKEKPDKYGPTEEYYVLKSDKKIKHGNYKKLGYKDCLVINGYYKNNKKDSTWTEYFWRTKRIESQGNYKDDKKTGIWLEYSRYGNENSLKSKGKYLNGKRTGIWEFYDQDSELIQQYNFDLKQLLYFNKDEEADKLYDIKTESGNEETKLDRPPMFIGGKNEAIKFLFSSNLKYPSAAKANGISGKVWISFFVDPDGKAIEHKIHEGIGADCDEEALRVVKEIPNNWLPALLNDKIVIAKYLFPISFTLK